MNINDQKIISTIASAIDHFPGYTLLKDVNSNYIAGNMNTARILGFKNPDQLFGITDHDINCTAGQYGELFISQDQYLIEQDAEISIIDVHPYADGEYKALLINKSLVKNSRKKNIGIICQCSEMPERVVDQVLSTAAALPEYSPSKYDIKNAASLYLCDKFSGLGLTVRESECLFYLLRGKSARQIAQLFFISQRTVESHINRIKQTMDCASKGECIEKAIELGYVHLIPRTILHLKFSS